MKNEKELVPTKRLLKSLRRAREDRKRGKASPVFSSVAGMKKWVEEHNWVFVGAA